VPPCHIGRLSASLGALRGGSVVESLMSLVPVRSIAPIVRYEDSHSNWTPRQVADKTIAVNPICIISQPLVTDLAPAPHSIHAVTSKLLPPPKTQAYVSSQMPPCFTTLSDYQVSSCDCRRCSRCCRGRRRSHKVSRGVADAWAIDPANIRHGLILNASRVETL